MTKDAFESARADCLNNKKIKKGIDLFEKYIGRIEWLHHEQNETTCTISRRKYAVIDVATKTVAFESDKLQDIANEYCVSVNNASRCLNSSQLLHSKYTIVRCGNE